MRRVEDADRVGIAEGLPRSDVRVQAEGGHGHHIWRCLEGHQEVLLASNGEHLLG